MSDGTARGRYGEDYVVSFEPVEGTVHLHVRDPSTDEIEECLVVMGPDQVDAAIRAIYEAKKAAVGGGEG